MMTTRKTYTSGGNNQTITGANMGNHHKVDKSQGFIDEGMTLITETDSDKYLNMAAKRNRNKKKKNYTQCLKTVWIVHAESMVDDFVERWTE